MSDLPDSYRIQHGCADCAHCAHCYAYSISHHCNRHHDRPLRLGEPGFPKPMEPPYPVEEYLAAMDLWEVWAWTHVCDPRGICEHWTEEETPNGDA